LGRSETMVYLIDDDESVRRALQRLLRSDDRDHMLRLFRYVGRAAQREL
jgi:FixJ family two-component response regulator